MLNISLMNIPLLSILLFVSGKFVSELLFKKRNVIGNMIKEQTVSTEGIIFLHSLGLLYVLFGMFLDNTILSLGFKFAGLALILHTTYVYWNNMGLQYKVSVLILGLGFVLFRIYNTENNMIEQTLTNKTIDLIHSFLSKT